MTKQIEPTPITIDGRKFLPVSQAVSSAQDDYILVQFKDAGIYDYIRGLGTAKITTTIAQEILYTILRSGYQHYVIAAFLTEVGKPWTREEADRNAIAFANVTANEDKIAMREQLVGLVIAFFKLGEASLMTSPNSSAPKQKAD